MARRSTSRVLLALALTLGAIVFVAIMLGLVAVVPQLLERLLGDSPVLRFLLSPASAFVTAQPFHVSGRASWNDEDTWHRPLQNKVVLVTGATGGIGVEIGVVNGG